MAALLTEISSRPQPLAWTWCGSNASRHPLLIRTGASNHGRYAPAPPCPRLRTALLPALVLSALARPAHAAGEAPAPVHAAARAVSFHEGLLNMGTGPQVDISRFEKPHAVLPGNYASNIVVNGEWRARLEIRIADQPDHQGTQPCFERDMLVRIGVALDKIDAAAPAAGGRLAIPVSGEFCGPLGDYVPGATASFDGSDQTLTLSVPQIYLSHDARGYVDPKYWDAGIDAGAINYSASLYRNRAGAGPARLSGYVGINASVNLGSWHLSHLSAFNWSERGRSSYETAANYLQHDLPSLKSQLYVGDLFPYRLAAWRLRGHLRRDEGDLWTRAANYHSRTPRHNARYREQLMRRAWRWSQWLRRQFNTHSIDDIRPPSPPADHSVRRRGEAAMAGTRNHGDHPAWP